MIQNQETYVAFIDLEKAFDKIWSSAIFYPLWKSAVFYLLWRIMHKLNNNQETRVMTKFGLIDNSNKRQYQTRKTTLRPGIWTTDR